LILSNPLTPYTQSHTLFVNNKNKIDKKVIEYFQIIFLNAYSNIIYLIL